MPLSAVMVALRDEMASSRLPESKALRGSDISAYLDDMAVAAGDGDRSRPDEEEDEKSKEKGRAKAGGRRG